MRDNATAAAALAHRLPGKWIGMAVLANTFRHPSIVAKAALGVAGRDPDVFTLAAQLSRGTTAVERREALAIGTAFVRAGAGHVSLGLPASATPNGLALVACEVAWPLVEAARRGRPTGSPEHAGDPAGEGRVACQE